MVRFSNQGGCAELMLNQDVSPNLVPCRRVGVSTLVLDRVSRGWRTWCRRLGGCQVGLHNHLSSRPILLMLNFAHDGTMFIQLNKASIPHTHAHLLLATGWPRKVVIAYILLSLACMYVGINLSKLPGIYLGGWGCGRALGRPSRLY